MSKDKAEEKEIINAPKKIYLQIGCKDYDCTIDFKELSDVTWSVDKIDSDDIEYVLSTENSQLREALRELVDQIDEIGVNRAVDYANGSRYYRCMISDESYEKAKQLLTDKE